MRDYRIGDVVEVRGKWHPKYNAVGTIESMSDRCVVVWFHHQDRSIVWAYTPNYVQKHFSRYF